MIAFKASKSRNAAVAEVDFGFFYDSQKFIQQYINPYCEI